MLGCTSHPADGAVLAELGQERFWEDLQSMELVSPILYHVG